LTKGPGSFFSVSSVYQQVIAWRGIDERGESGNEERLDKGKMKECDPAAKAVPRITKPLRSII